jgi:prepilin-type N-terminal cleavage/methylation domain-containing protein
VADRSAPERSRIAGRRDGGCGDGFTLIEVLIVVTMIAIITTVLAAVVTVVLRTAPPAEVRASDARSVQGLVTWLPQDVDAAPPGGFNRDHAYWPCGGTAPADSHNIIAAEWTESTGVDWRYAATYRYELAGDSWRIARYACDDGGTGTMGPAERINLTSELPEWSSSPEPARVTMCRSAVTAGATCPVGDVVPLSEVAPPEVHSLKLYITRIDGVVATIDAAPKNPDQSLADDPNASPNLRPELGLVNYVLPMFAGDSATIDVVATHGAYDPESDPISAAIDSTEPLPAGITAFAADPTFVEVTADAGLSPGVKSPSIVVIVSDNRGGWIDALVTVEILPEPNLPPTVSPSDYLLTMQAGQTVVVPLGTTHGVSDPNGDPVTVSVVSYPSGLTNPPRTDSPGPLDLEIRTPGGASLGLWPEAIVLEISDGRGGVTTATISLQIAAPFVNQSPVAAPTNVSVDLYAGQSVSLALDSSHGVSDPDGDPLGITDVAVPAGIGVSLDGALNVTITADPGLAVGPILVPVELEVSDIHGDDVDVTVTVNIVETPSLPSDCALGTLVANPSSVARHGGGGQPRLLREDVVVTLTYSGSCDGLTLTYDTGDTSGLGIGTGRVFPPGSPTSVVIVGRDNGGTEKWAPGTYTLTANTTSDVAITSITTTLTVS